MGLCFPTIVFVLAILGCLISFPTFSGFFSVAFHAIVIAEFPTIRTNAKVKFDRVKLNDGNG